MCFGIESLLKDLQKSSVSVKKNKSGMCLTSQLEWIINIKAQIYLTNWNTLLNCCSLNHHTWVLKISQYYILYINYVIQFHDSAIIF